MNRDLIIGLAVAIALHAGLALGGDFLKSAPAPAVVEETIPIIELTPLPPAEPELPEYTEPSGESGGDLSEIAPPMQADTPAPTASTFVQRFQPLPPPGITRPTDVLTIPVHPGGGLSSSGGGAGFGNLFDVANLDQVPVLRTPIRLTYPMGMERTSIAGKVIVKFTVDTEGNVQRPYIVSASHREFEAEALRAVTRAKFKPGRKNGRNVNTLMIQTLLFTVPDKK